MTTPSGNTAGSESGSGSQGGNQGGSTGTTDPSFTVNSAIAMVGSDAEKILILLTLGSADMLVYDELSK
jgi:dihydroxyacetone kinase DhaKLM complex PTS-EIIA-like component DhaM